MKVCRQQRAFRQVLQRQGDLTQGIRSSSRRRLWTPTWCMALALCLGLLSSCGGALAPTQTVQSPLRTSPTSAGRQPFHAILQTFDRALTVTLTITPNRAGTNVFMLHVNTNHSSTLTAAVNVTLYTTMQDMPMGTDALHLHADSNNSFSAVGILSMQGDWAIGIVIQTLDHRLHKGGVMLVTPS